MNSLIRFFTLRFDRTFSGHGRTQFAWLAGVLLLFFGFIYLISWFFSFPEPTDTPSSNSGTEVPMGRLLQLICLFIDPGSVANVPAELRWFSLIVAIMGLLLFTGLLISVVSNMLERHVERYREGNISYPLEKHVVIIGFDEMVPMLVLQICTDPQYEDCYILIQSVQPSSEVRNRIHTVLDTEQEKRVLVLHAQRNSTEELEKLYTTSAREIFLIGESNEYDHDSLNIDSLQKIVAIHRKKSNCPRITVSVLFEYQTTYAAFQVSDLAEEWRKQIDFHPFNFYEEWAKKLLVKRHYGEENAKVEYPALDREPLSYYRDMEQIEKVHTILPNQIYGKEVNFLDIEFEFIKGQAETPEIQQLLAQWAKDPQQELSIAICLNFPPQSMAMGLYLPDVIYDQNIPVFIRQETSSALLDMLNNRIKKESLNRYSHVYPFGMLTNCFDLDRHSTRRAQLVNYIYDFKNKYKSSPAACPSESELLDGWNKLQVALQWSNLYCADSVDLKLRSLGFGTTPPLRLTSEQIELMAEVEHNRWNMEKLLLGYRKPTPEEEEKCKDNAVRKEYKTKRFVHTDIRPYYQLDEGTKEYDRCISECLPLIAEQ